MHCAVCYDNTRLQIDGQLYRHGPRDRPCIGSGTLPHQASVHPSQDAHDSTQNSQSQSSQFNVACSNYNAKVSAAITDSTINVINDSIDVQSYNEFVHPTRGSPQVKRIFFVSCILWVKECKEITTNSVTLTRDLLRQDHAF